jgi:ankyrin repeat protein
LISIEDGVTTNMLSLKNQSILMVDRVELKAHNESNRALFDAAFSGTLTLLQEALGAGADPNQPWLKDYARSPYGLDWTSVPVLAVAASRGHVDIVEALLDAGAEIESQCLQQEFNTVLEQVRVTEMGSALTVAAKNGHYSIMRLLLDRGAHHTPHTFDALAALESP